MGGGGVIVLYIKYVISVIIFLVYVYYTCYILLFRSSREAPASSALGTTCGGDGPEAFPESAMMGGRTVYIITYNINVLY